jgi:hypothetical protein
LKEQNVAIEIIIESTGLSYEAIERIWVNNVLGITRSPTYDYSCL